MDVRLRRSQYVHLTSSLGSISRDGSRCDDVLCHNRVGETYLKRKKKGRLATGDDIWILLVQSMQRLSLLCCFQHFSILLFPFSSFFSPWQHFLQALINPQLICPPPHTVAQTNTLKLLAILELYCHCFSTNRYLSRASCRSLSTDLMLQSFSKHQFLDDPSYSDAIQGKLTFKLVPAIQSRAIELLSRYITAANKQH